MWVGTNVRFCYTVFIKKKGDFLAMKRTFLFATIASILSINAYAVSSTVTSKDYVDNKFQEKIPVKQAGWADTVITPTDTAGTVGQRGIYDYTYDFYNDTVEMEPDVANYLAGMYAIRTALEYVTDADRSAPNLSGNSDKVLPVFSPNGNDSFSRVVTTNTLDYQGAWDTGNVIPTLTAVNTGIATKQEKKTCAGWMDGTTVPDATHTDANCVLWNLPD